MDAAEKPFLMVVEDVFLLNQGTVVRATGRMERGRVRAADDVETVGFGGGSIIRVAGVDGYRVRPGEAVAGMNVGLLLPGVEAGADAPGQVLAAPGSIGAHAAFGADLALFSQEQGGAEVRTGDGLSFSIRGAAVTVTLEQPAALEDGRSFAFRHHARAAGSGTVTRLVP